MNLRQYLKWVLRLSPGLPVAASAIQLLLTSMYKPTRVDHAQLLITLMFLTLSTCWKECLWYKEFKPCWAMNPSKVGIELLLSLTRLWDLPEQPPLWYFSWQACEVANQLEHLFHVIHLTLSPVNHADLPSMLWLTCRTIRERHLVCSRLPDLPVDTVAS